MIKIRLSQNKIALIDDEDVDLISCFKWYVYKTWNTFYAIHRKQVNGKRQSCLMHRLIINAPDGMCVDHINGNGLDNRRENLRLATNSQNMANMKSISSSTSKYKGVCWHKSNRKWLVYINCDKQRHHLGYYNSEVEAAKIYDIAAVNLFGNYARLNFDPKTDLITEEVKP